MNLDLTPAEALALPVWVAWSAHRALAMVRAPAVLHALFAARGWMGEA